jgi:hypothetical protein
MVAARRRRGLLNRASGESTANAVARRLLDAEPAATRASGPQGGLELLPPIGDLRTARDLADKVADALMEAAPFLSPSIVRLARFVFEELGANVVQHSGLPETGRGFASVDPSSRELELAFADAGVGFRASLQRNPEMAGRIADDAEALQLALSPRVTGTSAPRTNLGIGLKALTDFSDLLGGDMWLASGAALLHRKTTAGQRTNTVSSIPPWQGSWICLEAIVA